MICLKAAISETGRRQRTCLQGPFIEAVAPVSRILERGRNSVNKKLEEKGQNNINTITDKSNLLNTKLEILMVIKVRKT